MLPNSPNVEAALFSEEGIAAGISEGKIVIDMSSINPVSSQRFAEKLAGLGVEFLDALRYLEENQKQLTEQSLLWSVGKRKF